MHKRFNYSSQAPAFHVIIIIFFYFSYFNRYVATYYCDLNLHLSHGQWHWTSFHIFIYYSYSFFNEFSPCMFCLLFIRIFGLLCYWVLRHLPVIYIWVLCHRCGLQAYSLSFNLLNMVFLEKNILFSWILIYLFSFYFMNCVFSAISKSSDPFS